MAHLTCNEHGRRVMVLPGRREPIIAHRSDTSHCDRSWLVIGAELYTADEVLKFGPGDGLTYEQHEERLARNRRLAREKPPVVASTAEEPKKTRNPRNARRRRGKK